MNSQDVYSCSLPRELSGESRSLWSASPELIIAVATAIITALGYGGAYLFELGYARFLGVPGRFVDVSWGGTILCGLVIAFVVGASLAAWMRSQARHPKDAAVFIGVLTLATLLLAVALWSPLPFLLLLVVTPVALFAAKLMGKLNVQNDPPNRLDGMFLTVGLCFFLGLIAYQAGHNYASRQLTFAVLKGSNFLLAGTFGDTLIFCGYEAGPRPALNGQVKVLRVDQLEELDLHWTPLGRLDRSKARPALPGSL